MIGCSRRSPMRNAATCWRSSKIGVNGRSTLIASQLPPTAWHAAIGEPSVADAICDRVIHQAHRLTLKGPTMRDPGTRRGTKAPHDPAPAARGGGMPPVDPTADRRSWGILGGRRSPEEPVDRAASVEIAQNAIPTPAWTAHRTRRPQRPTGPVGLRRKNKCVR